MVANDGCTAAGCARTLGLQGGPVRILRNPGDRHAGCALIGTDRELTGATLQRMGCHPNVRGTAVMGLDYEGVPATEVGVGSQDANG
jgi:hypothetical protein